MLAEEYEQRIRDAIAKADRRESGLAKSDFTNPDHKPHWKGVESMNEPHYLHIINNLCSYDDVVHTHIGFWKGASLFVALEGNAPKKVFAVDSFFGGSPELKQEFLDHSARLGFDGTYELLDHNCFEMDLSLIDEPVTFHLYDNGHEYQEQYDGIYRFAPTFADTVIVMVDNFCDHVVDASDKAVEDLVDFEPHSRIVCDEHCRQCYYVLSRVAKNKE